MTCDSKQRRVGSTILRISSRDLLSNRDDYRSNWCQCPIPQRLFSSSELETVSRPFTSRGTDGYRSLNWFGLLYLALVRSPWLISHSLTGRYNFEVTSCAGHSHLLNDDSKYEWTSPSTTPFYCCVIKLRPATAINAWLTISGLQFPL